MTQCTNGVMNVWNAWSGRCSKSDTIAAPHVMTVEKIVTTSGGSQWCSFRQVYALRVIGHVPDGINYWAVIESVSDLMGTPRRVACPTCFGTFAASLTKCNSLGTAFIWVIRSLPIVHRSASMRIIGGAKKLPKCLSSTIAWSMYSISELFLSVQNVAGRIVE